MKYALFCFSCLILKATYQFSVIGLLQFSKQFISCHIFIIGESTFLSIGTMFSHYTILCSRNQQVFVKNMLMNKKQ